MSTMKTMEEILVELGDVFGLSQFEQKWIENHFFEIPNESISRIKNSILQYAILDINNSSDEHLRLSKLNEIREALTNHTTLENFKLFGSKETYSNFKIILSSIEIGLTEFFESKKTNFKLERNNHQDQGGDPEHFKELVRASEILTDEKKRKMYDEFGVVDGENGGTPNGMQFNGQGGFPFPFEINLNDLFGGMFGNPPVGPNK